MAKYVMVCLGGAIGALIRFVLGGYIGNRIGTRFPLGTFVINVSGSLLIGFILTLVAERTHMSPNWRYLVVIGFIGAYTTFSTFEYETMRAVQEGQLMVGSMNVLLSVVAGFAAVWLGMVLARLVP